MPTHRKVSCYGSKNNSEKAGFTTSEYNTVCYECEGRDVKIMEGKDCFRRGLSHCIKLPLHVYKTVFCIGKNGTYSEKEQFPIRFLSGENYFGAVALDFGKPECYIWKLFYKFAKRNLVDMLN